MLAVLGSKIEDIEEILNNNSNSFKAEIANDNSNGQLVLSGKIKDLESINDFLKTKKIKSVKLSVSAPFHCSLMSKATEEMSKQQKIDFKHSNNIIFSNVTGQEVSDPHNLKNLLIDQIEKRVRWRESIINMINKGVEHLLKLVQEKCYLDLLKE